MSNYAGSKERIREGGGSVAVTIADNVGQGNGGTSLPCAGCWVAPRAANTGIVKMNIGAAASASLGVEVTKGTSPRWVPIDDVDKLYFYGASDNDVIDITYLTD